jgi:hypothetical protein
MLQPSLVAIWGTNADEETHHLLFVFQREHVAVG